MEHFKKYFLLYTVLPLFILAIAASYVRFMVTYDFEVVFEGYCDPYSESCFEYCEDDECTEPFHYTWFTRNADELRNACGDLGILDCEYAEMCEEGEDNCYATYCDPNFDEDCEFLTEEDFVMTEEELEELFEDISEESIEEEISTTTPEIAPDEVLNSEEEL